MMESVLWSSTTTETTTSTTAAAADTSSLERVIPIQQQISSQRVRLNDNSNEPERYGIAVSTPTMMSTGSRMNSKDETTTTSGSGSIELSHFQSHNNGRIQDHSLSTNDNHNHNNNNNDEIPTRLFSLESIVLLNHYHHSSTTTIIPPPPPPQRPSLPDHCPNNRRLDITTTATTIAASATTTTIEVVVPTVTIEHWEGPIRTTTTTTTQRRTNNQPYDHYDDENDCYHDDDDEHLHTSLLQLASSSSSSSVSSTTALDNTNNHNNHNTDERTLTTTTTNSNTNNDNNDNNNDDMSLKTSYSMISSPRNNNNNNIYHSYCLNPNHTCNHNHNNNNNNKSWIGFILCFVLALILPLAYQQYTLEEHTITEIIFKKTTTKPTLSTTSSTSSSSSSTIVSKQQRHKIILVPSTTLYTYPPFGTNNNDDDDIHPLPETIYPDIAWFMSYPGTVGISHIIQSIERYSQTTTATNYGATLVVAAQPSTKSTTTTTTGSNSHTDTNPMNKATTATITTTTQTTTKNGSNNDDSILKLVNPIYPVHPHDQCGPYLHRLDLPLPSTGSSIITNTYCSTAQTTSSTVVCTECVPKYHNLLTFERACATGNRIYEQHYRSVQYDTRVPTKYIHLIQNPFVSFLHRLRITFQQKYNAIGIANTQRQQPLNHHFNYFTQYIPTNTDTDNTGKQYQRKHKLKTSVAVIDYCHYLDTTYSVLGTTDLLDNYTHVPCHTEFYKYIQWYNDAVTLTTIKYNNNNIDNDNDDTDKNSDYKKPIHYIYYENYISDLQQQQQQQQSNNNINKKDNKNNDVMDDLFDFLNLTRIGTGTSRRNDDQSFLWLYDSILSPTTTSLVSTTNAASTDADTIMMMILTKYIPPSLLQSAADMMYELALPATWELIHHYLDPYLSSNTNRNNKHHYFKRLSLGKRHRAQSIPLSLLVDTNISDDSIILSPLLFDDYVDTLYENAFHDYDVSTLEQPEPNDPNPQVVWLLSFPNSGTSYTINNLEVTCNVTTGSNYAKDWDVIVPVRPELVNGPFLHNTELRLPHYVLTKTHCFGYCDDCGPQIYNITNNDMFQQGCLRAEMTNRSGSFRYDTSIPVKAVHIYRSPFDNIVARMHLAVHKRQRQGNDVSLFSNSHEGLSAWCKYLDDRYSDDEEEFFSPTVLQLFKHVPCHADWYRYVQWHNHAYIMTEKLNLTVYDLFYEDYTHDYDRTLETLFDYLAVSPKQSSIDFYVGKSYEMFFDIDHKRNAALLIQALAIPPVWLRLRHYFEDYTPEYVTKK